MLGFTHAVFAGLVSLLVFGVSPVFFLVSVFGGLLPDINYPLSFIGKLFYDFSRKIHKDYGHRTITHPLLFLALTSGLVFLIDIKLGLAFALGVVSHFFLDMLTNQGVQML